MGRIAKISRMWLYPLSLIYGAGVYVRNRMFDMGILKERQFDIPVVGVGNIAVGGTGKTPHVEYIVERLSNHYNIAVLSRGYKRKTRGFVLATRQSTPAEIGDEPYQIFRKFGGSLPVAVCESRVKGIRRLREECPDVNLIVLDDSFQHRYVKPTVSVVLSEYNRPVFTDHLLPYGHMREPASALSRADLVVVSKCPDNVTPRDFMLYTTKLNLLHYQKTFFTRLEYGQLVSVFPGQGASVPPSLQWLTDEDMVLSVAGIANPRPFVKYIKSHKAKVWVNLYPDHHNYNKSDFTHLVNRFEKMPTKNKFIVTTEKDAVKLAHNPHFPEKLKPYIYYLPVRVGVLRDEADDFVEELLKLIRDNHKTSET